MMKAIGVKQQGGFQCALHVSRCRFSVCGVACVSVSVFSVWCCMCVGVGVQCVFYLDHPDLGVQNVNTILNNQP